ncbi:hypothetical protein [Methylocaldum szegediense]|nr:hypothetical protein [Methylocaldum szegediense]
MSRQVKGLNDLRAESVERIRSGKIDYAGCRRYGQGIGVLHVAEFGYGLY